MSAQPTFNEAEALRYPLFQDDFGSRGDKCLSDAIVSCRIECACCECLGAIVTGSRYRKHVGIYDGQLRQFKICEGCCRAMSLVFNGQPDAMVAREVLRAERTKKGGAS